MNKTKIDKEVVTLKDVHRVIIAWRNSCIERGQAPAGVCNFIARSHGEKNDYGNLQWAFGEIGTALFLHHENSIDLSEATTKYSRGEEMTYSDAIIFRM